MDDPIRELEIKTVMSNRTASVLTEDELATLFKIIGIEDPGKHLRKIDIRIDWSSTMPIMAECNLLKC